MIKNNIIKESFFLLLLFLVIFYIYLISLFPSYKNNDSPEISAAVYTLGICHPPGYPFFINTAKIFSLFPIGNIAFRINLFSSFMAILTLVVTYYLLINLSFYLFKKENKLYSIISVFLLSFSYIFWNQAIEAKGGIYQLNLLFMSIILFLYIKLLKQFNLKYFYLLIYIYSLSLTNHWQSMMVLLPVIIILFWKYKSLLKSNNLIYFLSFFILGLSIYVFLFIRGFSYTVINWGNTSDIIGFFEFISRRPYTGEIEKFTLEIIFQHIKVFTDLILHNYWFLWIFAIPGVYILFKKDKKIFFLFIYILFAFTVAVIFYNRTKIEVIWLIKIFLMPLQYIILILIATGIFYILNNYQSLFVIIFLFVIFFYIKNSFNINYRARDFLSYDMAFNLFNTIKKDAFYLGEHDMYLFPVLYEQVVNKKRLDIKIIQLPFLQFDWGKKQVQRKYNIFFKYYNLNTYYELISECLESSQIIYRDFSSELFDKILKLDYIVNLSGLLKTISKKGTFENYLIFKLYSLRGFYSNFAKTDENTELIERYMIFSAIMAEELMNKGKYNDAIELYKYALKIPVEKLDYKIYYNMAICYNKLNNFEKEFDYLNKCIVSKPDFVFAYERLAIYYYKKGLKNEAKIYLENAIKYGSTNKEIIDLYNEL